MPHDNLSNLYHCLNKSLAYDIGKAMEERCASEVTPQTYIFSHFFKEIFNYRGNKTNSKM